MPKKTSSCKRGFTFKRFIVDTRKSLYQRESHLSDIQVRTAWKFQRLITSSEKTFRRRFRRGMGPSLIRRTEEKSSRSVSSRIYEASVLPSVSMISLLAQRFRSLIRRLSSSIKSVDLSEDIGVENHQIKTVIFDKITDILLDKSQV